MGNRVWFEACRVISVPMAAATGVIKIGTGSFSGTVISDSAWQRMNYGFARVKRSAFGDPASTDRAAAACRVCQSEDVAWDVVRRAAKEGSIATGEPYAILRAAR